MTAEALHVLNGEPWLPLRKVWCREDGYARPLVLMTASDSETMTVVMQTPYSGIDLQWRRQITGWKMLTC